MDKITLIAADFDSLEESCLYYGTGQYTKNKDCPIARAMKRTGYKQVNVWVGKITYSKWFFFRKNIYIKGGPDEVERCRKELLNGADETYIQVVG